jgi:alcohol dehydrogenase class IV
VGDTSLSQDQNAQLAIQEIAQLVQDVGLEGKLSDFGVSEDDLVLLAQTALQDAVTINNPSTPSLDDVLGILGRTL